MLKSKLPGTPLSKLLRSSREKKGLSQRAVADKLGYESSQFISNWERGVSQPPMNTLLKLIELYEIDKYEVFDVLLETTLQGVTTDLKNKFFKRG